jgi:hypothetical protein
LSFASFAARSAMPPSLPSCDLRSGGDANARVCGKTSWALRAGVGPTGTAAVFQQRAERCTADFPHESLASLQEYDGRNMAARLRYGTFTAGVLRGSLFRHIIACNAVAFGS